MVRPSTYFDLLKHPLWQKKRLEVLKLSQFTCESCGSEEKTLHVHHAYYEKGLKPWEYPVESLHCLCEDCHREAQDRLALLHKQIGKVGLTDIDALLGYALGLECETFPNTLVDVFSYEVAMGVGACWGLTAEEVIQALTERTIDGWTLSTLSRAKKGLPPIEHDAV